MNFIHDIETGFFEWILHTAAFEEVLQTPQSMIHIVC
jgi:hypothetical protein